MNERGRDTVRHGPVVRVTNRDTHHFYVCDLSFRKFMNDAEGRVMVFLTREQAQRTAVAKGWTEFRTVGMGDEKWKLFQAERPHVVVGPA